MQNEKSNTTSVSSDPDMVQAFATLLARHTRKEQRKRWFRHAHWSNCRCRQSTALKYLYKRLNHIDIGEVK